MTLLMNLLVLFFRLSKFVSSQSSTPWGPIILRLSLTLWISLVRILCPTYSVSKWRSEVVVSMKIWKVLQKKLFGLFIQRKLVEMLVKLLQQTVTWKWMIVSSAKKVTSTPTVRSNWARYFAFIIRGKRVESIECTIVVVNDEAL